MPGCVHNLELAWENHLLARFLKRLASFSRLIVIDRRGGGLSDRLSPEDPPSDARRPLGQAKGYEPRRPAQCVAEAAVCRTSYPPLGWSRSSPASKLTRCLTRRLSCSNDPALFIHGDAHVSPDDHLPEDFSCDDFMAALDVVDTPDDVDLPTDWDGCVLVATMPVTEIAATVSKLEQAGIQAHSELPEGEEIGRGETGSVFVPFADLGRAREVLRLKA